MNLRPLQHTHLLAAIVFLTAVLVLSVQLITPSPVVISLGGNGGQTARVGEYFTYREVTVVGVAAFIGGVSGTYLVVHDRTYVRTPQTEITRESQPSVEANGGIGTQTERTGGVSQPAEERWEENLEKLAKKQETIYELLIEADGELAQRELVEKTDFSKATVSRTLDKLEHRGLVERQRSGMGNTIRLQ